MKHVYIDCSEFGRSVLTPDILSQLPNLEIYTGDPDSDTLEQMLSGAVGVINGHTSMSKDLLSRHPSLRSIVFLGTGASSYVDVAAAEQAGIAVRTVRGYGDRTIAEHAFALIMAGARQLTLMDREIRNGEWQPSVGVELAGKQLGVVGTGGVGSELIRIADAFGMEVVAWNRSGVPADLPCKSVTLDELLESSRVISLHLALTQDTCGLLNRRRLEKLRRDAILVNVARGALVDEKALCDLLCKKRIAHAALDVFEHEPLAEDHPFRTMDNVTLSAHAGFKSREAMVRLLSEGFAQLRADLTALHSD